MSLVTLLDDSDLTKIRKSIFIFAAIGFVAWYYQIEITAPKDIVSALSTVNGGNVFTLSYDRILKLVGFVEVYLLIRLKFSWDVSHALYTRQWLIDVDENIYSFDKIRKELRRFKEYSENSQKPISDLLSSLATLCENQENILKLQKNNLERASENYVTISGIPNKISKNLYETKEAIEKIAFPKISNLEKHTLLKKHPEVEQILVDSSEPVYLGSMAELLNQFYTDGEAITNELNALRNINESDVNDLKQIYESARNYKDKILGYVERFKQYENVLPETLLNEILSSKPDDFKKARKARETERLVFEFWLPFAVSFISVLTWSLSLVC